MGTALKAGALGAAAGLTVFAGGALKAINAASDFEENLNKVRVVFGPTSKAVEDFAKTAARNLGLSQSAALGAAGTFGNLFTAMNITTPKAAEMSEGILKLAADLASFNNIKPEEALEKLRAGLVGETEPLRTLGVNLNAAAIEAKALEMGLVPVAVNSLAVREATLKVNDALKVSKEAIKEHGAKSVEAEKAALDLAKAQEGLAKAQKGTTGELDAASKAQAAYALIMEQTKTAQGDFSRTSDGMANSIRIIKATFADLQVQIGQQLLPLIAPLISKFGKELPGAIDTAKATIATFVSYFTLSFKGATFGGEFGKVETAAINLGNAASKLKDIFKDDLIPAIKDMWEKFGIGLEVVMPAVQGFFNFIINNKVALVVAIAAIGTAMFLALGPISQMAIGLAAIVTSLGYIKDNWAEIQKVMHPAGGGGPKGGPFDFLGPFIPDNLVPPLPGRHAGGPVGGGHPYVVGEEGPEVFVPGTNGTIIPNGAGGGNVTVHIDNAVINARDQREANESASMFGWGIVTAMRMRGMA